jgi:hypothetical protein
MATLTRDFHENLQEEGLQLLDNPNEYSQRLTNILREIPPNRKLPEPAHSQMNWEVQEAHTTKAIQLSKNNSATGLDGCPYELWKVLKERHNIAIKNNKKSFNVIKTLIELFQDIQKYGVDA